MSKKIRSSDDSEYDPPLTLSEVGRMVGKHRETVRRWITDGLLTAVRLPTGLYGVRRSEVMKFLGASALADRIQVE